MRPGFTHEELDPSARQQFLAGVVKRGRSTWTQAIQADKSKAGLETLPASILKPGVPSHMSDDKVIALRYQGSHPMVRVRERDVFHIMWIESGFGELYDHGT